MKKIILFSIAVIMSVGQAFASEHDFVSFVWGKVLANSGNTVTVSVEQVHVFHIEAERPFGVGDKVTFSCSNNECATLPNSKFVSMRVTRDRGNSAHELKVSGIQDAVSSDHAFHEYNRWYTIN